MDNMGMRRIYGVFADLLEYPSPDRRARIEECLELLAPLSQEAASPLEVFRTFFKETAPSLLEELYTGTFDLQMVCYPYVGYQLFGESYKRGAFMAGLKEQFRTVGFGEGSELPDHLAVVLRYLSTLEDVDAREELSRYCLLPALGKMSGAFEGKENPYGQVVSALVGWLREVYPAREKDQILAATEEFLTSGSVCHLGHTPQSSDGTLARCGEHYQAREE